MNTVTPRADSKGRLEVLREAAAEELARRDLIAFCERMIDGFQSPPHIRLLADLLMAIERGEKRRLLVTLHPGSGKSMLLQAFASFYLGRNSTRRILAASAGAELSERNSRASRAFFGDSRWPFDTELSRDTTAMNRWSTTRDGGLSAHSVGSLITGWRGALILGDDLQNDALSIGERDSLWQWWREVLMPRLEPIVGAVVLIQQRWGADDLPGRIMESPEAKDWTIVRIPALSEGRNDVLGRPKGESMWPSRWPVDELERQRVAMGSRAFECAFQGNPIPLEGNAVKAEWIQRYDEPPRAFEKVVCALDSAAKTGIRNDYSVIVKLGLTRNSFYVLDVWRAKVEFPGLIRRVRMLETEDPAPAVLYAESSSNALPMIQALRETRMPIVPVTAKGSKESRIESCTGVLEAKRVFLPKEAPWLLDFERELFAWPQVQHDDQIDALALALNACRRRPVEWSFALVGNKAGGGGDLAPFCRPR